MCPRKRGHRSATAGGRRAHACTEMAVRKASAGTCGHGVTLLFSCLLEERLFVFCTASAARRSRKAKRGGAGGIIPPALPFLPFLSFLFSPLDGPGSARKEEEARETGARPCRGVNVVRDDDSSESVLEQTSPGGVWRAHACEGEFSGVFRSRRGVECGVRHDYHCIIMRSVLYVVGRARRRSCFSVHEAACWGSGTDFRHDRRLRGA